MNKIVVLIKEFTRLHSHDWALWILKNMNQALKMSSKFSYISLHLLDLI